MLERLKTLVRMAAKMTNTPMEKMSMRTIFCFNGMLSLVMSGRGMKSIRVSDEMLKQACTMA